jgi:ClpA/ClpB-like protein
MPGPAAPPGYGREAAAAADRAMEHLTSAGNRCLDAAQAQSRQLDDNHVGTEHIVLGVLTVDSKTARALAGAESQKTCSAPSSSTNPGQAPADPSR